MQRQMALVRIGISRGLKPGRVIRDTFSAVGLLSSPILEIGCAPFSKSARRLQMIFCQATANVPK